MSFPGYKQHETTGVGPAGAGIAGKGNAGHDTYNEIVGHEAPVAAVVRVGYIV